MKPTNKAGEGSRSDTTAGEGRGEIGGQLSGVGGHAQLGTRAARSRPAKKRKNEEKGCWVLELLLLLLVNEGMKNSFTFTFTLQLALFASCSFYSTKVKGKITALLLVYFFYFYRSLRSRFAR